MNLKRKRFINLCTYLTLLSKGHSDAFNSEDFFGKNFMNMDNYGGRTLHTNTLFLSF